MKYSYAYKCHQFILNAMIRASYLEKFKRQLLYTPVTVHTSLCEWHSNLKTSYCTHQLMYTPVTVHTSLCEWHSNLKTSYCTHQLLYTPVTVHTSYCTHQLLYIPVYVKDTDP